jgi:type II secretory pathway predicted ATPase ExeA
MGQIQQIAEATKTEQANYLDTLGWDENPFVGEARVDEYVLPDQDDIADVTAALQNYTGPLLIHSQYSGAGKSTLVRVLLDEFDHSHYTAYVGEHNVTPYELVGIVADSIGVGKSSSTKLTEQKINDVLDDWDDDPVLLGIDEFGLNDPDTLHTIQFLNDIGIKVILTGMTGQWDAIEQLGSDGRAFQRRVSYQLELDSLTREQTTELVKRRIMLSSGGDPTDDPDEVSIDPLTPDALDVVHEQSKGIPGVIVAGLAELVGLGAYRYSQTDDPMITADIADAIEYANGEVESDSE